MCTLSYVCNNRKIIITSNRDEKVLRPSAIAPKNYLINNKNIFFPKDPKAGGTWFAVTEKGEIIVLLNGAKEKHLPKANYRKSRGIIVLEMGSADNPTDYWSNVDLSDIEPFTIVLIQKNMLLQFRWDSFEKETTKLDASQNHIWSSATLYDAETRKIRADWFEDFLVQNQALIPKDVFDFHQFKENENKKNGLIIDREYLKTLSITQAIIDQNHIVLNYLDLQNQEIYENAFLIV